MEKSREKPPANDNSVLKIDEISHKKGQGQFMTILSIDNKARQTVVGKKSEDIKANILAIPGNEKIKKVCIDMCSSFAKAIREALPESEIILDRFHLIKMLNKKLWDANKKEFGKLCKKFRKKFSRIRYLLVQDYDKLSKSEKRWVKDYLRKLPEVKEIHRRIREFRKILLSYRNFPRSLVSQKITAWMEGGREFFGKMFDTFETWWDEIINACIYRDSNASQEGMNNKIKLIKRRGFGYRNWVNFEARIFAQCS